MDPDIKIESSEPSMVVLNRWIENFDGLLMANIPPPLQPTKSIMATIKYKWKDEVSDAVVKLKEMREPRPNLIEWTPPTEEEKRITNELWTPKPHSETEQFTWEDVIDALHNPGEEWIESTPRVHEIVEVESCSCSNPACDLPNGMNCRNPI